MFQHAWAFRTLKRFYIANINQCRMLEEIVCYVLRNSPLRVVKVSRTISDIRELTMPSTQPGVGHLRSPNTVTVESILTELPVWTTESLAKVPDNQLIVFWSEIAVFYLKGPVIEKNTIWYNVQFRTFEIYKRDSVLFQVGDTSTKISEPSGKTEYCNPDNKSDPLCQAGEGEFEFVLLATSRAPGHPPEKVALQVYRDQNSGIAHRISIARIKEEQWIKAGPRRTLVMLR